MSITVQEIEAFAAAVTKYRVIIEYYRSKNEAYLPSSGAAEVVSVFRVLYDVLLIGLSADERQEIGNLFAVINMIDKTLSMVASEGVKSPLTEARDEATKRLAKAIVLLGVPKADPTIVNPSFDEDEAPAAEAVS